jgi:hypothetical protein
MDDHRGKWLGHGPELNGKILYRRVIVKRKVQPCGNTNALKKVKKEMQ